MSDLGWSIRVFMDGSWQDEVYERRPDFTVIQQGRYTSESSVRPFVFGKIALAEDTAGADNADELGSIVVQLWRIDLDSRRESKPSEIPNLNSKTYSETSKKAQLEHVIELGAARSTQPATFANYRKIGTVPVYTLTFKYRSKAYLEATGVIETASSPAPQEPPDRQRSVTAVSNKSGLIPRRPAKRRTEEVDLSDDETEDKEGLQAALASLAEAEARVRKLKSMQSKKVKKEAAPANLKPLEGGSRAEPVDLTLDSDSE